MQTAERTTKVQTAFRFSPDLLRRLKNKAREENVTVNRYVELVLERSLSEDRYKAVEEELRHIRRPDQISPEIQALGASFHITREDLLDDERALYIWDK